jgi:N-acetylmuramoyl-L-alanine amidase
MAVLPDFPNVEAIERHARDLVDPIERLRFLRQATVVPRRGRSRRWIAYFAFAMAIVTLRSDAINRKLPVPRARAIAVRPAADLPDVWPVEQTREYDLYSNGLRIENKLTVSNEARSYYLIDRKTVTRGPERSQPAGIVFHTTESDQMPFEQDQTRALKRIGQELLLYVRNKRAYHFLIDRFGRVHRIVVESDIANHAGRSVWADSKWSYVDLNESFLGVAFEARMQADQAILTEAQVRAAKALTEMLRAKYALPAENCVLHAQVSINPSNRLIGLHTDWGSGFPFHELGLPDNYQIPNPSIYLFGFEYDSAYTNATGPDLWKGLAEAEKRVREAAAGRGMTPAEYRKVLQQRFRDALSLSHERSAEEENQHESN